MTVAKVKTGPGTYVPIAIGGQGPTGPAGPTGDTGPTGPGVPAGGTEGQVPVKQSGTDYDVAWGNQGGQRTINAQTGTTYTLVLTDVGKFVTMTNASASTLTVPPNSSVAFPVGTVIEGAQLGAGQVTLTAGAGVTLSATPGLKTAAQYATFGLLKLATNTWLAYGRLS